MGVKISEMTADTSVGGSEKIPVLDGTTNKTITTTNMSDYTIDQLAAADTATPTTGDYLSGFRSTTEKRLTLNAVSSYAVGYVFTNASEADPAVSGDMLVVDRSGTKYKVDVDTIKDYCTTGVQTDLLDVSGLTGASLNTSDYFLVVQTSTPKQTTLSAMEAKIYADFITYIGNVEEASSLADANTMYLIQSGVPKRVTLSDIADYVEDEITDAGTLATSILGDFDDYVLDLDPVTSINSTDKFYTIQGVTEKYVTADDIAQYAISEAEELPWTEVDTDYYTALPASTSTITMTNTSDFDVGYPVKYTYSNTTYYGIVTAVSANSQITIAGATLSGGVALTALYAGRPERVIQKNLFVGTDAFDAVQDVFSTVTYEYQRWELADAYLVSFAGTLGVADTGASQPKVNVKVGGNLIGTQDSNKGITLSATPGGWIASTAVAISTTNSNYKIERGDAIDIRCTEAGTNGDADCLSLNLIFVLE